MGVWQDLQFAIRLLVKDKWFALVATVALALGIGVNATVFTFVNAVLQTTGRDPLIIASIAAILALVALAASVWPARAATQLDPLVALRHEQ